MCFLWKTIWDTGATEYQENRLTGKRRAIQYRGAFQPINHEWIEHRGELSCWFDIANKPARPTVPPPPPPSAVRERLSAPCEVRGVGRVSVSLGGPKKTPYQRFRDGEDIGI